MRTKKAIKLFSKEYCNFLTEAAKKRSITVEQAEIEFTKFIELNYVFTGKGNIWRTFNKLPKAWEFYLATKTKKLDFQSTMEVTSFIENVPLETMMKEMNDCISLAYENNKDNEIWKSFGKQPTVEELTNALIDMLKNHPNDITTL